jgi:26S proteasome regulatory subunit N5
LDLDLQEAEKRLSQMVVQKAVYATIDRPAGIINFTRPMVAAEVLNEWSGNVSELLTLLERTCHLIHRESMVHAKVK